MNHTTTHRAASDVRKQAEYSDHIAEELRRYEEYLRDVRGLAECSYRNLTRIVGRLLHKKFAGRPINISDTSQTITLSPEAIEVLRNRKPVENHGAGKSDVKPSKYVLPGDGRAGHFAEPKTGWKRVLDRAELLGLEAHIQVAGGEFIWPLTVDKPASDNGRTTESFPKSLQRARQVAESMNINASEYKLENLRIHDLRRTLGSWQARTGASLAIIGKSLNHKSTSTTAIYARLDLDPVRESVERATSAMMIAAGLKDTAEVVKLTKQKKQ